eukprot:7329216-Lingulodinium_polyedra.AAC.1
MHSETLPWPLAPALATALALAPDLANGPGRSAERLVRGSLFRPADLRPRAAGRRIFWGVPGDRLK